jgi:hypothetical protein
VLSCMWCVRARVVSLCDSFEYHVAYLLLEYSVVCLVVDVAVYLIVRLENAVESCRR